MTQKKNGCGCSPPCAVTAILFVGLAIFLLLPGVQSTREAARRLTCQTKIKDLVLAANLYEGKYRHLPPSCHVKEYTTDNGVTASNKDGYSFLVDFLPEMESEGIFKYLNVDFPLDEQYDMSTTLETDGLRFRTKLNMPDMGIGVWLPMYLCPSDESHPKSPELRPFGLTNYKAVSATTRLAYEVSSRTDAPPEGLYIYGTGTLHKTADGVMYPGSRTTLDSITDGTAHTFLITETVEPIFSRWMVGQECGLYTMPEGSAFSPATDETPYVHPTGYTLNKYGSDSTIPKGRQMTNLNRDYTKSPYPWAEPGFGSTRYAIPPQNTRLGPGSAHKGVTMHGFVDGSADSIPNHIDAAAYFFLTTRSNDDPSPAIADAM